MTKATLLNKSQALNTIHELFKHFTHWISQSKDPTLNEIGKIFTSDFQLFSNGLLVTKNLSDHLQRLLKLRKNYSSIEIEGPFEELMSDDGQLVIYYALNLTSHVGEKRQLDIMAIATLEDNKLKQWKQVTHERGKDWIPHTR